MSDTTRNLMRRMGGLTQPLFEGVNKAQLIKALDMATEHYKSTSNDIGEFQSQWLAVKLVRAIIEMDPTFKFDGYTIPDGLEAKSADIKGDFAKHFVQHYKSGKYTTWLLGRLIDLLNAKKTDRFFRFHGPTNDAENAQWLKAKSEIDAANSFFTSYGISAVAIRVMDALDTYESLKGRIKDLPDINTFKTTDSLISYVQNYQTYAFALSAIPPLKLSSSDAKKLLIAGGYGEEVVQISQEELAKALHDTGNNDRVEWLSSMPPENQKDYMAKMTIPRYVAVRCVSAKAASDEFHGAGTSWCTRFPDEGHVKDYLEIGPLYVVYVRKGAQLQDKMASGKSENMSIPFMRIAQFNIKQPTAPEYELFINDTSDSGIRDEALDSMLLDLFIDAVVERDKQYLSTYQPNEDMLYDFLPWQKELHDAADATSGNTVAVDFDEAYFVQAAAAEYFRRVHKFSVEDGTIKADLTRIDEKTAKLLTAFAKDKKQLPDDDKVWEYYDDIVLDQEFYSFEGSYKELRDKVVERFEDEYEEGSEINGIPYDIALEGLENAEKGDYWSYYTDYGVADKAPMTDKGTYFSFDLDDAVAAWNIPQFLAVIGVTAPKMQDEILPYPEGDVTKGKYQ